MTALDQELSLAESLRGLFEADPQAMADPFPIWRRIREEAPIFHFDASHIVFSRYQDVKRLLRDESDKYTMNALHSRSTAAFVAELSRDDRAAADEYYRFANLWMVKGDVADHARLRRIAHRAFTPRRIAALREAIVSYTDELLDAYAGEEICDLMDFAYRLPLMVIVELLGCPPEDREEIHKWSSAIGATVSRHDRDALVAGVDAIRSFGDYVNRVVEEHRTGSRPPDLVSILLGAEEEERLSDEELTAMFVLLLFAGHETTTNLLGLGLKGLLENRNQWLLLCSDPSKHALGASDELLRWVSPTQYIHRIVAEDHEVSGVSVASGQMLITSLVAANRDPGFFDDPDAMDITRANAGDHLAFGYGPRYCLGAAVARLEGEVAFEVLARRFPAMELVPHECAWARTPSLRRLLELPVRLGHDYAAG